MQKPKRQQPQQPEPIQSFIWTLLFGAAFATLGWNYGVTELVDSLGGPDGNVNYWEGMCVWLAVLVAKWKGA
jgi:hypothetical protein